MREIQYADPMEALRVAKTLAAAGRLTASRHVIERMSDPWKSPSLTKAEVQAVFQNATTCVVDDKPWKYRITADAHGRDWKGPGTIAFTVQPDRDGNPTLVFLVTAFREMRPNRG